ncbi:MAG TPA: hypothetical protein VHA74_00880 [Candidatus Dojkabacteria bacterium]|nr:hypothetical protein [Candidatus Dojkabacteria bacterium]
MLTNETEYLSQHDWEPRKIEGIDVDDMLNLGIIYSPLFMHEQLVKAQDFLVTTKGPNQNAREIYAHEWLDFWIDLYQQRLESDRTDGSLFVRSNKIIPFAELSHTIDNQKLELFKNGFMPRARGLLFLGSGEGTPAHRFAIGYMSLETIPVLAFERDSYTQRNKARRNRFIPIEMLITMMSDLHTSGLITVLPERLGKDFEISDNEYYQKLFNETSADYCYATIGEPYTEEKVRRGVYADFVKIPKYESASTSERVKRLYEPESTTQSKIDRDVYKLLYMDPTLSPLAI